MWFLHKWVVKATFMMMVLQNIHTFVKRESKTVFPLPAEPLARGPLAVPFICMADGVLLLSW